MAGEPQATESERPALSIIEGTGNLSDGAGPELRTQAGNSMGKAREARMEAAPSTGVEADKGDTAVSADDGAVVSAEKAASLRKPLDEFRTILISLVQDSPPATEDSPDRRTWISRLVRTMTSRSVFGRQLTHGELVGQYASLYPVLERPSNLAYAEMALFGSLALKSGRSVIAQTVLEEVRFFTLTSVALVYVMRGVMRFTFAMIIIGLLFGYAWVTLNMINLPSEGTTNNGWAEMEITRVALAALFGCLGGVVSLLMRLAEFDKTKGRSKEFLMLSGGTQPLVGGIFAAVIAALFISEVIIISGINQSPKLWLFVVVGFISGFSERFTQRMLGVAENRFSPASSQPDRKTTTQ
jgi:hypothetical protein